eukprot:CAMPEP_0184305054 /NCGR_PEP_ID=MMETSP1049-20130417/14424_1 /TAXON_ID=77928 /ORGANISM="Proteomonas sulcata, Strain CCMP704" /LENGTH=273 /DNA_ID=CAMNT_0026617033 /DNA_START=149 /DNA_END=970 /DNA_ORIENTATION=+
MDLPVGAKEGIFYALFSKVVKPNQSSQSSEDMEAWNQIAQSYGYNVANELSEGRFPPPEDFKETCVLSLSVSNYSQLTSKLDALEVSQWMSKIHEIVSIVCRKYKIQRVQTRADGLVCLSGTNKIPGDISNTAVSRMKDFVVELHQKLETPDLKVEAILKSGVAFGPATMAFIKSSGRVPSVSVFGDCVNMANRLQSKTRPGFVHFHSSALTRLAGEAEDRDLVDFDEGHTSWFDIRNQKFVEPFTNGTQTDVQYCGSPSAELRSRNLNSQAF